MTTIRMGGPAIWNIDLIVSAIWEHFEEKPDKSVVYALPLECTFADGSTLDISDLHQAEQVWKYLQRHRMELKS